MNKLLHFSLGGFICAIVTITSVLQEGILNWDVLYFPFIGYGVVFVCSIIKEFIINNKNISWNNILIMILGCVIVHISTILGILFNICSR